MTTQELSLFREALQSLSFCGTSIREFALQNGTNPHTLYNYISGQQPSVKYYKHLMKSIRKHYPAALSIAEEGIKEEAK